MTVALTLRVVEGADTGATWPVLGPRILGRDGDMAVTDPAVSRRHLAVEASPTGLRVTDLGSAGGTFRQGTALAGPTELVAGDEVVVGATTLQVLRLARFHPLGQGPVVVVRGPDGTRTVAVRDGLTIGRDPSCDVTVAAAEVSRVHAVLRWDGTDVRIEDNRSANGTLVNGHPATGPTLLAPGDRADLGRAAVSLEVRDAGRPGPVTVRVRREGERHAAVRTIDASPTASVAEVTAALVAASGGDGARPWLVYRPDQGVLLHPDDEWSAVGVGTGDLLVLGEGDATELPAPAEREWPTSSGRRVSQLPRSRFPAVPHEVSRPRPPETTSLRGRGTMWQIVGGLGAVIVGLAVAVFGGSQFALFGIMAGLIGAVTIGASVAGDQSRRRHGVAEYRRRVATIDADLASARSAQVATALDLSPDDDELASRVERGSSRLWERRPGDPDALHLRVGTGRRAMLVDADPGRGDSPYDGELDGVLARYRWLDGVPVCAPGPEVGGIGVCGDGVAARRLVTRMLVEAAALHAPHQLRIWVAASGPAWTWARWLPHGGDEGDGARVATDASDASAVLQELRTHLSSDVAPADELHLLVVDGGRGGVLEQVLDLLRGRGVGLVVAADRRELPNGLGAVVEVAGDGTAGLLGGGLDGPEGRVTPVGLDAARAEALAIRLGALADSGPGHAANGLLDLLDVGRVDALDIEAAWSAARSEPLLVPIGVDDSGEPVTIGFRRDGPHGMIAGTTGSGKSELLQSLLVALAATHRPSELELFLIDYKGGATFSPLASLPHVVGMVTDLEGDLSLATRAFTALDAEIERRKRVLERAGVANIAEHDRLPSDRRQPLPNLLVVIDELALLVERLPEVKERLDTVTTQGRSLGVHLLLATQSPGGVITSAIRANTNLWICLRVVSEAESMELLGTRDAARIPDGSPGRGFVRLGAGDERRPLQVARIARPLAGQGTGVTVLDERGRPVGQPALDVDRAAGAERTTELDVVVEAIVAAAAASGEHPARPLWLPPLPDALSAAAVGEVERPVDRLTALLGVVDRPERQTQEPYLLDLTASGNALVCGLLGFGKSTTLLQIGADLAGHLPPSALHLYGIEAGGGALSPLAPLPHAGAIVSVGDPERLVRMLSRLTTAVDRRRAAIAESGLGSFTRWRASGDGEPWIVLLVDDYPSFKEASDQIELGRPLDLLNSLLQNGPAVGIHVVLAISQSGDLRLSQTSLIPARVLFRQSEVGEYNLLELRLRAADAPTGPPGRALVAGGASLQVCRPDLDLEAIADRWASDPVAARPRPVERMPAVVARSTLPSPTEPHHLVLGRGGPELEPVAVRLGPGEALVVAGPLRSGRSTALLGLVEALVVETPRARCTVVAPRPSPLRDLAGSPGVDQVVTDVGALPAVLEELTAAADERTVLVIDDAEALAGAYGTIERLDELVRTSGQSGLRVVVAARVNDLPGLYDPWVRYLVSLRRAVLLQPTNDDAFVVGAKLPTIPGAGTPGRGVVVDGHQVVVLQVATPELGSPVEEERSA